MKATSEKRLGHATVGQASGGKCALNAGMAAVMLDGQSTVDARIVAVSVEMSGQKECRAGNAGTRRNEIATSFPNNAMSNCPIMIGTKGWLNE